MRLADRERLAPCEERLGVRLDIEVPIVGTDCHDKVVQEALEPGQAEGMWPWITNQTGASQENSSVPSAAVRLTRAIAPAVLSPATKNSSAGALSSSIPASGASSALMRVRSARA